MDISKLDKADVLAALYNNARAQGMGFMHYTPEDMTSTQAAGILAEINADDGGLHFDYLKGRVMKVNLAGPDMSTALYNRDNGPDAAENALANLISVA